MRHRSKSRAAPAAALLRRILGTATLLPVLAAALTQTGCVVYDPPQPFSSTGAVSKRMTLAGANFRVVNSHVEGEATCPHVLFFQYPTSLQGSLGFPSASGIAIGDPDLLERAMADLHTKHDLTGKPQQLHNIVEEWSISNYAGIYAEVSVKITAEVVEFLDDE